MKKYAFAFVANSAEIANLVVHLAASRGMDVQIHLESLERALPVAERLLDSGVDVVLGGGATGKLLRSCLGHPVVTVDGSPLDLLNALMKAKRYSSFIGVSCYLEPPEGLKALEELLGIRIMPLPFANLNELVEGISRAVSDGVGYFVGGGICKEIAASCGMDTEVVIPGRQRILDALEEAMAIAVSRRTEREKAERFRIILESITEGVIGVDKEGKLNILNKTAAEKLELDPAKSLGQYLPNVVKGTGLIRALESGKPEIDHISRIAGNDVVLSALPIEVGGKIEAAVATFRLASGIQNIERKLKERLYLKGFVARYGLDDLIGDAPCMAQLKEKALRYARTDASVLIQGETGTGKEVLAQSIHALSERRNGPFVAVNCAALPESLLESELFGYEEGAFTGAKRGGKMGLFELAGEGTIFLDEIADIPLSLQARLLRVLEEKAVIRLGGDRIVPVNVRVISSAHRVLSKEVQMDRFRADLYFRLAVLKLFIPPLRERKEDLGAIVRELLIRHGSRGRNISDREIELLSQYDWPGNIRELDALIRRFLLLREGKGPNIALLRDLLEELHESSLTAPYSDKSRSAAPDSGHLPLKEAVEKFENEYIRGTLEDSGFNKSVTARRLGISVPTLWRKLK